MSRINTNVSSLIAQRVLNSNNASLNTSLERLSTGLRINSGADDPAGLIASKALDSEKVGIQSAIGNATRATNIIGTAEGGLNEVGNLLTQLNGLVNQSASTGGLSQDEIAANQLQVDSILTTINRIAGGTSFEGTQLLNGNFAYTTSSVATSAFSSLEINAANLPANTTKSVVVQVTNSATEGQLTFTGASSNLASAVTLQIAGNDGTQQLSFASGTSLTQVATAINNITSTTGVTASANGSVLSINASAFGSDQFVSVQALSGTFNVTGGAGGKAFGKDALVQINGATAQASGVNVTYRDSGLDLELKLSTALNAGGSKTFGITGGGATFSLGSKVTEGGKASIGIQSVSTGSLGNGNVGFLSSLASGGVNNLTTKSLVQAQKIVDEATNQVSNLRGRLGAFQKYTLGSTINSLGVAYENVSAADSNITDTDFAEETANLTRSQILSQAATTVLSQANSAPQNALTLLKSA